VPDRVGNGAGELIVLLSTITDPADARADELATAYNERWEQETANDQLKPTCAARAGCCARGCPTWSTRRSGPT
jgi:hypothetical protein